MGTNNNDPVLQRAAMPLYCASLSPFISQMPITDFTVIGNIFRAITVLFSFIIAIKFFDQIKSSISGPLIVGYGLLVAHSLLMNVFGSTGDMESVYGIADISILLKWYFLTPAFFILGIFVSDSGQAIKLIRWFSWVAIFASCQAVVALICDSIGTRDLNEIFIDDGVQENNYRISWYGLLGGNTGNGRSNFYFSESTHFCHFLFIGFMYCLWSRRKIGLSIITLGIISTFSATGCFLALVGLSLWLLRKRSWITFLWFGGTIILGSLLVDRFVRDDQSFSVRLFDRENSWSDKFASLNYAVESVKKMPLGYGVRGLSLSGQGINTAPGVFNWILWYGLVGIIIIIAAISWLAFNTVSGLSRGGFMTSLCLILVLGAISHGPLPKYYVAVLLGVLYSETINRNMAKCVLGVIINKH